MKVAPYKIFWLSIPLFLGVGILGFDDVFDIQFHNTYYVIASIDLGVMCSVWLFCIGGIYWFFRNKALIAWMTIFHEITTIFVFLIFIFTGFFNQEAVIGERVNFYKGDLLFLALLCVFSIGQIVFLINLLKSAK